MYIMYGTSSIVRIEVTLVFTLDMNSAPGGTSHGGWSSGEQPPHFFLFNGGIIENQSGQRCAQPLFMQLNTIREE